MPRLRAGASSPCGHGECSLRGGPCAVTHLHRRERGGTWTAWPHQEVGTGRGSGFRGRKSSRAGVAESGQWSETPPEKQAGIRGPSLGRGVGVHSSCRGKALEGLEEAVCCDV